MRSALHTKRIVMDAVDAAFMDSRTCIHYEQWPQGEGLRFWITIVPNDNYRDLDALLTSLVLVVEDVSGIDLGNAETQVYAHPGSVSLIFDIPRDTGGAPEQDHAKVPHLHAS
jgi:hypothetical protein